MRAQEHNAFKEEETVIRSLLICLIIVLCPCLNNPAFGEKIHVVVNDAETGMTVPARAYLRCAGSAVFPAGASTYRRGAEEHFLLAGTDTLDLPAAPCELEVHRGLEYEPARVTFTAKEGMS